MSFVVGIGNNVPLGKTAIQYKSGNTILVHCEPIEMLKHFKKMPVIAVESIASVWVNKKDLPAMRNVAGRLFEIDRFN